MAPATKPEDRAREKIDEQLTNAGWKVQSLDEVNLNAARGVAVREFKMALKHGIADHLLFVAEEPVPRRKCPRSWVVPNEPLP